MEGGESGGCIGGRLVGEGGVVLGWEDKEVLGLSDDTAAAIPEQMAAEVQHQVKWAAQRAVRTKSGVEGRWTEEDQKRWLRRAGPKLALGRKQLRQ
jgi:hypothetical protein